MTEKFKMKEQSSDMARIKVESHILCGQIDFTSKIGIWWVSHFRMKKNSYLQFPDAGFNEK